MSQPSKPLTISIAMDTHIGQRRPQNQDALGHLVPTEPDVLASLGQIFVLADGVGGLTGGDLASQYAVSTVINSYYEQESGTPPDRLARAIAEANSFIYAEGQEQDPPVIMATTVVVAVIRGSELIVGSVGDSPAYLMRDAKPRKLTQDHTVSAMADHADIALPDDKDTGRKLVRAVGSMPSVKVDIITGRVRSGDHVVLCSDGLTLYVTPEEIDEIVASHTIEQATTSLIDLANERGGFDNISVIVLRVTDPLTDDQLIQLPRIPDPMAAWGRPRTSNRSSEASGDREPGHDTTQETARVRPRDAKPRSSRSSRPSKPAKKPTNTADNPLRELWAILRGKTVLTGIGLGVLLVVFVIIMIAIAGVGGDDEADQAQREAETATQSVVQTATATVAQATTRQAQAIQTDEAILAATAAEAARLTLTPPTPLPTSGPQLSNATWFRVLPGDPIPAYQGPDITEDAATPLEEDESFRVTLIAHEAERGPWYQVVDNLGREVRWVNAPSLHQRIVVVDESGQALPDEAQPVDLPPPDFPTLAPTAERSPTPTPTPATGTPQTSVTPNRTTTPGPSIPYGEENWQIGDTVTLLADLDLCRVPDVTACDIGAAATGDTGTITEGPYPSGEHWWWQIELDDGREGWIAQVLLGTP